MDSPYVVFELIITVCSSCCCLFLFASRGNCYITVKSSCIGSGTPMLVRERRANSGFPYVVFELMDSRMFQVAATHFCSRLGELVSSRLSLCT